MKFKKILPIACLCLCTMTISCDKDDDVTPEEQETNKKTKRINKQPDFKIKQPKSNQVFYFGEKLTIDYEIEDDSACVAMNYKLYPVFVENYQYKDANGQKKYSTKWKPDDVHEVLEPTKKQEVKGKALYQIPDKGIDYGYYKLRAEVVDCNHAVERHSFNVKILSPNYEDTVKTKLIHEQESLYFSSVPVNTSMKRSSWIVWRNKYFLPNTLKDITFTGPDALQFKVNKSIIEFEEQDKEMLYVEFHSLQIDDMENHTPVYLAQAELHAKDKDDNEYVIVLYGTNDY